MELSNVVQMNLKPRSVNVLICDFLAFGGMCLMFLSFRDVVLYHWIIGL